MTFDPNQPLDDVYIVDLPSSIRNNFIGIQQGSDSFAMTSCNLSSLETSTSSPEATSSVGKIYMKEDVYGNQNLFVSLPPENSPSYSITSFPPTTVTVTGTKNSTFTLNCSFLAGGIMVACGIGEIINQQIFSFDIFAQVYSITGNGIRAVNDVNLGAYGVVFVPMRTSTYNPVNTFTITINKNDTKLRGLSLLIFGKPSSSFLAQAYQTPSKEGKK